jgi:hypothetical protein
MTDVPKIVTDTTTQDWSRRHFMGGVVGVAAVAIGVNTLSPRLTCDVLSQPTFSYCTRARR